jgi:hypothetical protein
MSPSKSLRYDSTDSGEQLLLQKVEEIGSSVKVEIKHMLIVLLSANNHFRMRRSIKFRDNLV